MASKQHGKPPQEPLSFNDTPESLVERAKTLVSQNRQAIQDLVTQVDPETATFQNFLLHVAHLENHWASISRSIRVYQQVSPSEDIRNASIEAMKILSTEGAKKPDISKWIDAIINRAEKLDLESQKLLEAKKKKRMVNKELASKRRRSEITRRMKQIGREFEANIANDNGGLWATGNELLGVPANILNGLEKGTGVNEGSFRVTWDWSVGLPIMEHAVDPDFRQRLYIGRAQSCLGNISLFKEIISLRHERATLMGQPNWMTSVLQESLLCDLDAVKGLLARFEQRIKNIGVLESLQETKRLDNNAKDKTLYLWDQPYYTRMWMENNFAVDQCKIAEYFPLMPTVHGMLQIYGEMFGLSFREVADPDVWHEDVKLFEVWDNQNSDAEFSGYLYVDAIPRLGKYKLACCVEIEPSYIGRSGQRRFGTSLLLGNFNNLLAHGELIVLFHEMGHCMHELLSRTKYATFHGTRFGKDFIEIPSVLLEHWCWLPAQLERLSQHYNTGAKIPHDLVSNLIRTEYFCKALDLFQVALNHFDIAVHTPATQKEADEMDITDVYNTMICNFSGLSGPEMTGKTNDWGHGYKVTVHHVTGYPGYYYTYMASYCIAEKIWTAIFAKDPMSREAAMRYRRLVLEKGATETPSAMLENLLGEKLDVESLCV